MVGNSLTSPLLTFDSTLFHFCSSPNSASATSNKLVINSIRSICVSPCGLSRNGLATLRSRHWKLLSTSQIQEAVVSDEDKQSWESCKQALSVFSFSDEEKDKILGKAFGQIHSPYWGEDRKKEVPKLEVISEILNYVKDLGLTDEDIAKLIKKFPEVLGCSLEDEVKVNVQILDKQWGITGKTLKSLILRNPRALGYNIDCKGDCMAQCSRCWVRF